MSYYFADEELSQCLWEAFNERSEDAETISKNFYDHWRRGRTFGDGADYPTAQTFEIRFHSWNDALHHFGLPVNEKRSGLGQTHYSEQDLINFLVQCERDYGKVSAAIYNKASRENGWPALATIRNRFDGWSNAKKRAGLGHLDKSLALSDQS